MKNKKYTEPSVEVFNLSEEEVLTESQFLGDGDYNYSGAEWME